MAKEPSRKPILGITMGDPAGIGPEVIVKALARPLVRRLCRPVVIGSPEVLAKVAGQLKAQVKIRPATVLAAATPPGVISVLDPLSELLGPFTPGRVSKKTGAAQALYIKEAVRLALEGRIAGIVTAPINKEAINLAGYPYPGHTEMLAELTGAKEVGMMIVGGPLRFLFATTHVAIKDMPKLLTPECVERAIRLCHLGLTTLFGIKRPRIAVAALNPHGGEGGLFGTEERTAIGPGVARARAQGFPAVGPLPADTLIGQAARGKYDAVVAMYHDQGLIPLKLAAFGTAVNITVGLPIIRTSVDHGTAYDIVGQGLADEGSLLEAIRLAATFAGHTSR
ncbi:MAG: 4-hydroxythreonine-4-phosphate dehydrogenase PdxA [Nitrospirota bacterium]